ncbi:hypothetical protein ACFLUP_00430 [Chloroflexota bacterium]
MSVEENKEIVCQPYERMHGIEEIRKLEHISNTMPFCDARAGRLIFSLATVGERNV